jgi:hypothetical protein
MSEIIASFMSPRSDPSEFTPPLNTDIYRIDFTKILYSTLNTIFSRTNTILKEKIKKKKKKSKIEPFSVIKEKPIPEPIPNLDNIQSTIKELISLYDDLSKIYVSVYNMDVNFINKNNELAKTGAIPIPILEFSSISNRIDMSSISKSELENVQLSLINNIDELKTLVQNTISRDTDYTELLTQKINTLKNQTQTGGGKEESFYDVVMRYQTGGAKSMYETRDDYKLVREELQNLSNFKVIKDKIVTDKSIYHDQMKIGMTTAEKDTYANNIKNNETSTTLTTPLNINSNLPALRTDIPDIIPSILDNFEKKIELDLSMVMKTPTTNLDQMKIQIKSAQQIYIEAIKIYSVNYNKMIQNDKLIIQFMENEIKRVKDINNYSINKFSSKEAYDKAIIDKFEQNKFTEIGDINIESTFYNGTFINLKDNDTRDLYKYNQIHILRKKFAYMKKLIDNEEKKIFISEQDIKAEFMSFNQFNPDKLIEFNSYQDSFYLNILEHLKNRMIFNLLEFNTCKFSSIIGLKFNKILDEKIKSETLQIFYASKTIKDPNTKEIIKIGDIEKLKLITDPNEYIYIDILLYIIYSLSTKTQTIKIKDKDRNCDFIDFKDIPFIFKTFKPLKESPEISNKELLDDPAKYLEKIFEPSQTKYQDMIKQKKILETQTALPSTLEIDKKSNLEIIKNILSKEPIYDENKKKYDKLKTFIENNKFNLKNPYLLYDSKLNLDQEYKNILKYDSKILELALNVPKVAPPNSPKVTSKVSPPNSPKVTSKVSPPNSPKVTSQKPPPNSPKVSPSNSPKVARVIPPAILTGGSIENVKENQEYLSKIFDLIKEINLLRFHIDNYKSKNQSYNAFYTNHLKNVSDLKSYILIRNDITKIYDKYKNKIPIEYDQTNINQIISTINMYKEKNPSKDEFILRILLETYNIILINIKDDQKLIFDFGKISIRELIIGLQFIHSNE